MLKKLVLSFAIAALAVASAETYSLTLYQPSVLKGTELKAGSYKIDVNGAKATLSSGKKSVEVPVAVETMATKSAATTVRFSNEGGKYSIAEIRLAGTTTKLVFNQ